jgi:hypothetical protein
MRGTKKNSPFRSNLFSVSFTFLTGHRATDLQACSTASLIAGSSRVSPSDYMPDG